MDENPRPSIAFLPALIPTSKIGNNTGKVKTGSNMPGLSVLVAILLLMVKRDEIPIPVNIQTARK